MNFQRSIIPRMVEIHQKIQSSKVKDVSSEVRKELRSIELSKSIAFGEKIAITAGSRGVAQYLNILATVVDEIRKAGGKPIIIPAMGSHGGASTKGQIKVLSSLGITKETVGAPIQATMEVDEIGRLGNGLPVFVDRNALKANGIVVVSRVKPHTDFKDSIESGLMKMMVIGLGKQKGAEMIHRFRSEGYHKLLPEAARLILKKIPIILGLAIVENANHEIAIVKAIKPKNIEIEEKELLKKAKSFIARIPFQEIDLLIVDEIGKEISGTGMDTNVTGRFFIPGESDPLAPKIKSIVVLDLTKETHGNAVGIGLADVTTKKLVSKIDYMSTFVNTITGGNLTLGKTPVYLPNDRDAIRVALNVCGVIKHEEIKIVRIKNTQKLNQLWISESLLKKVKSDPILREKLEIIGQLKEMQFDVLGNLAR
jgi:hypothetical protein